MLAKSLPLSHELHFYDKNRSDDTKRLKYVIGVDEAGRGPLAGPVVIAAVAVPLDITIQGVNDSKAVTESNREEIFNELVHTPGFVYSIVQRDNNIIDDINILAATLDGMATAVISVTNACDGVGWDPRLPPKNHINAVEETKLRTQTGNVKVLVDGNKVPPSLEALKNVFSCQAVVKGDATVFSIAAASILAKVTRDRVMIAYDAMYPQFNFAQHKGYPTAAHQSACFKHGVCPIHRMTFKPLKIWLVAGQITLPEGTTRKFVEEARNNDPTGTHKGKKKAERAKSKTRDIKARTERPKDSRLRKRSVTPERPRKRIRSKP